jgi:hypothetical protein
MSVHRRGVHHKFIKNWLEILQNWSCWTESSGLVILFLWLLKTLSVPRRDVAENGEGRLSDN